MHKLFQSKQRSKKVLNTQKGKVIDIFKFFYFASRASFLKLERPELR